MGMVADRYGPTAGLALDGHIQSIDRAELKSTILMAENCTRRIHTDSMYVVTIWRRVLRFLRERNTLTAIQLQTARDKWQNRVAAPNDANHDLVDRLQDCVESRGKVHIQKVKGTHNIEEAMAGEWPEDRIGNFNADAAANRAQSTARPNLQEADEMVNSWKKWIKEHQELWPCYSTCPRQSCTNKRASSTTWQTRWKTFGRALGQELRAG